MTDKQLTEVIEGNKVIAEFMGWKIKGETRQNSVYPSRMVHEVVTINPLGETVGASKFHDNVRLEDAITGEWYSLLGKESTKYHESWNELMQVVEKIEDIGSNDETRFNVTIETNNCFIDEYIDGMKDDGNLIEVVDASNKLEAVWDAVIQFIQWYNQNKQS